MTFENHKGWLRATALLCAALIAPGGAPLVAQEQQPAAGQDQPKLKSADQLDSLVAPVALYPDPLLAQVLAASTYPLEIVQAQRWLKENAKLTGENLTKAAAKQPWDASVQALVAFPQALKLLDDNVQWTTELGNAFLDQQGDVMDAVQRMRKKAKDSGKLQTSKEQKVEVKTIEQKTIVEIQPSNPQVIYVPSYNPTVVYGPPPAYAYPPVAYPPPPSTGAVVATAAVSFGVGVMMGAMWSGCCHGGYGWGMGWGGNNVTINNNFNTRYGYNNVNNVQGGNRTNIQGGNRTNVGTAKQGGNTWQHNSAHRGSVPYGNRATAKQYGGTARDASGATQRFDRGGQTRNSGAADRGPNNRGPQASTRDAGADRGQAGARGNQDRVGNRSVGSDSGRQSGLSGSQSRERTEAASNRGFASTRQSGAASPSRSSGGGASSSRASSGGGGGARSRSGGGGRRR